VVGLRGCWEAPIASSTTMGLPDGKIPTTGSPTTEVIRQAEQFAFSVVQGRPTQCRHVYLRSDTCLGTRGTFTPKCERKRRGTYSSRPTLPLDTRIDSERYALAVRRSGFTQDERGGLRGTPLPRARTNTSENALLRICLIDGHDTSGSPT
jgi:hypothetical protein